MEAHAGALLQIAEYAEQVTGLRVAARAEHADGALLRRPGRLTELLEADGRLDVVSHDGFASTEVAAQHRVDAFAQKGLGEFRVVSDFKDGVLLSSTASGCSTAATTAS